MIDLTHRVIQTPRTPTPTRAVRGGVRWHVPRRALQVLVAVLLAALPLTNGLRLDLRRGEFYFAWHRMAAHDLFLLFWVSMLGVSLLSAVSFLYGRLWCGWVCPQTLASDFADSLRARLDKAFKTRPGRPRFLLSRSVWALGVLAVSLAGGVVLACYWLAPPEVFRAARAPWRDWAAGLAVYLTAGALAADMLWLRRKFCSHLCPYGPLMSVVGDRNTLAVRFLDERQDDCIGCHKCETDCPMGIDIKQGVGQHSCIGCGECIDSCNEVLGPRGKAGLIEFRYGLDPERATPALTWPQRLGFWDARRVAVAACVPLCLAVVVFLIYGTLPLSASVNARGAIARVGAEVHNGYQLTVGNNGPRATRFALSVEGLPQAVITPASITLGGHDSQVVDVTVSGEAAALPLGRTPIRLRVSGPGGGQVVKTIFYTPRP